MSIGLRLDLRQTQQLVMTPQLLQAIKLLQMSNLELADFVEAEIEKNPLLERLDAGEPAPEEAQTAADGELAAPTDLRAEDHALASDTFDTGTENLHDTSPSDGPSPLSGGEVRMRAGAGSEDLPGLDERLADRVSLRDHLRAQLGQSSAPPLTALAARLLVEELDEHGYLRGDMTEIANRAGLALEVLEQGLALLQSCDPTGVGARDLAECLALQLRERNRFDPAMAALLDNLDALARGELKALSRICGLSEDETAEMADELKVLDPRPCSRFDLIQVETLIPDVIVRRADWGGWHVELNPDTLPKVLIDRTYAAEVGRADCRETKQYIADCHASANWLIKSLDQRARTIVKIASEIVRRQERFLAEGISGLLPMTLREVAEAVDMHESTASRVTTNKYVATERGIFELKFFFTNGIAGGDGDISAEAVRYRIKQLVSGEAPESVLSDDAIVTALGQEGIDIARRTVAKYRKSLNIPSSAQRRRQKAMLRAAVSR